MSKIIFEDTRNKVYKAKNGRVVDKHRNIHAYFDQNGITVVRTKLFVGDYTLPTDQRVCIDTKQDMVEVSGNIFQQHKRFAAEAEIARTCGIQLIVLIEDDTVQSWEELAEWVNPHPGGNALTPNGERCYRVMKAMEGHYGCRFEFCARKDAGAKIMELLGV